MKKDYSSPVLLGLLLWHENQPQAALAQFKKINNCLIDHHGLGDIHNYFLPALYFPSLTDLLIKADFPVEKIIDYFKDSHLPWLNDINTCDYLAQKKPEILQQLLEYFPIDDLCFNLSDNSNLEIILDYFPASLSTLLKNEIENNHSLLEDNLFNYLALQEKYQKLISPSPTTINKP